MAASGTCSKGLEPSGIALSDRENSFKITKDNRNILAEKNSSNLIGVHSTATGRAPSIRDVWDIAVYTCTHLNGGHGSTLKNCLQT